MVRIAILFASMVALKLGLRFVVAPRYGRDIRARSEHLQHIPSQSEAISETSLARWLADKTQSEAVSGYVFPVPFPLDVLFLICLGLLLGFASILVAERSGFLSSFSSWIWFRSAIWPPISWRAIFKSFVSLTTESFRLLSALTAIKITSVKVAISQVAVLGALNLLSLFVTI
ncbi:hypothetical protein [Bradyrhizobium elkanii]